MNKFHAVDPELMKIKGDVYMPMLDTAEMVAKRYNISRETPGRIFAGEPAPHRSRAAGRQVQRRDWRRSRPRWRVVDKATGEVSFKDITLSQDEGPRPETTAEGLAGLKAVRGDGFTITAGNASQLSGRRQRHRDHERQARRARRASSRSAFSAASSPPAASRTKWASARCSPCRAC